MAKHPTVLLVVLDTNVYIQSLVRQGSFLDLLLRRALDGGRIHLFTSTEILHELRSKLEGKFGLSPAAATAVLRVCTDLTTAVEPDRRLKVVRDPDDNKILECALEAKAHLIVTADRDLLALKQYQDIVIAHPSMLKYWLAQADKS